MVQNYPARDAVQRLSCTKSHAGYSARVLGGKKKQTGLKAGGLKVWHTLDSYGLLALLSVAFLMGGFVKGAIGYGMPLVATPILLMSFSLPQVVLILVPPIFSNVIQGFQTAKPGLC